MENTSTKKIYPILFALMFLPLVINNIFDNDTWWLLALGRNILENGIPTIEPLAMHEGLEFVSQQWLSATIFQGIYSILGMPGLMVFCQMLFASIILLIYKLCTICSNNRRISAIITAVSALILSVSVIRIRPQLFTFAIVLTELILLEKYRRTGNRKWLIGIPILSVLEINLHASMWTMLFVLMLPFFAEWVFSRINSLIVSKGNINLAEKFRISLGSFKVTPLLIVGVISIAAGFLNPYGIKAMTYLLHSYEPILNNIMEMKPPSWDSGKMSIVILLDSLVLVFLLLKKAPLSHWGLYAGTGYLFLTANKGLPYFVFSSLMLIACFLSEFNPKERFVIGDKYKKLMLSILLLCVCFSVIAGDVVVCKQNDFGDKKIIETVTYLKENYDVNEKSLIYADYNTGGYLEYEGLKPFIDARAEVFLKANNKKKDYLVQFFAVEKNPIEAKQFLDEYKFEYVIVQKEKGISIYLNKTDGNNGYTKVYTSTGKNNKLEIWIKNDITQ